MKVGAFFYKKRKCIKKHINIHFDTPSFNKLVLILIEL